MQTLKTFIIIGVLCFTCCKVGKTNFEQKNSWVNDNLGLNGQRSSIIKQDSHFIGKLQKLSVEDALNYLGTPNETDFSVVSKKYKYFIYYIDGCEHNVRTVLQLNIKRETVITADTLKKQCVKAFEG